MTLPKIKEFPNFLKGKHPESFLLPAIVVIILVGIIAVGFLIPKKNKADEERRKQLELYTTRQQVEVQEGKTISVPEKILQISPEKLYSDLNTQTQLNIIQVAVEDKDWQEPHIKNSLIIRSSSFDGGVGLDREKSYIFVSSDGLDSALAINKLLNQGFSREKNLNLEGGLKAWKAKGLPLED